MVSSDRLSSLHARMEDVFRRAVAEFVGTFALIFVGAGAVLIVAPSTGAGNIDVAFAHGLVIAVMVSAVGHISGGHFNPAVTLGFLVTGRLSPIVGGAYWIAQFGGAVVAAALLKWIFPSDLQGNLGSPAVGPGFESEAALIIEAVLTFFLVWVRRSPRNLQVDRRSCDRPHDHARHADGRPDHRRRDEPRASLRPRAPLG